MPRIKEDEAEKRLKTFIWILHKTMGVVNVRPCNMFFFVLWMYKFVFKSFFRFLAAERSDHISLCASCWRLTLLGRDSVELGSRFS